MNMKINIQYSPIKWHPTLSKKVVRSFCSILTDILVPNKCNAPLPPSIQIIVGLILNVNIVSELLAPCSFLLLYNTFVPIFSSRIRTTATSTHRCRNETYEKTF